MERRLFAATLGALLVIADCASAALITFSGVIDQVRGNTVPFAVGDTFTGAFHFFGPPSASLQVPIRSFRMSIGNFTLRESGGRVGILDLKLDVSKTNLLYQIFNARTRNGPSPYSGSITEIELIDPAVGGVIPPFDQLAVNFLDVSLSFGGEDPPPVSDGGFGHLTSFPIITNGVPEGGSPLVFLGFAILSMALVGCFLNRATL